MKSVKYVWHNKKSENEDDILIVLSEETGLELAQLRRTPKTKRRSPRTWADAYADRCWFLRAVHYDDNIVSEHFGTGWDLIAYSGFRTVSEFKSWLENRRDREIVRQKNY
jgi:hypothetical protein